MPDRGINASAPTGPDWFAVVVDIPLEMEETLVALIEENALGAEFSTLDGSRGRLSIFAASAGAARRLSDLVRNSLTAAGLVPQECGLRIEDVVDGKWVEHYQAGLRPFDISPRFVVDPTGQETVRPGKVTIVLVPGRAFGTGEHETTRLCAAGLEQRVEPGSRWLDIGCGSGILSVVAHHCGAERICGIDIDPEAVRIARQVVVANGIGGDVEVREGSCSDCEIRAWDGIVANIECDFFLEEASALAALLRPGGLLLASGILVEQAAEVSAALLKAGLVEVEHAAMNRWALLCLTAPEHD